MMGKRLLLAAIVLIIATGCGVRPSAPIPGLPAPSGPAEGVALYFLMDNSVTLVLRPTGRHLLPDEALALLSDGPDGAERAQGVTSQVPPDAVPVSVGKSPSGQLTVTLSADVDALSTVAVDQIVCTAHGALGSDAPIILTGKGHHLDPRVCPVSGRTGLGGEPPGAFEFGLPTGSAASTPPG